MKFDAAPAAPDGRADEQAAFEKWLDRTCPSGDVEAVQRQWEASSDYAELIGAAPAAPDHSATVPASPDDRAVYDRIAAQYLADTVPAEVPMPEPVIQNFPSGKWSYHPDQMRDYGDAREAAGYAAGLAAVGWRDVADELPKEAQEVLFVRNGKTVHGAWIGGIFWHNNQKMAAAKWMPLPAPPAIAALRGEVRP